MEKQTVGLGAQGSKPQTYTDEYRRQVVDMVASTGRTATAVAAEFAETRSVCGWAGAGDVQRDTGLAVRLLRLACPAKWRSHLRGPESKRAAKNRALLDDICQVHAGSQSRYGSPRVHAALRARGRRAGRGRVERLMRIHGICGLVARPCRVRTTDSRHAFPVAPNLLDRRFTAVAPNQVWLADLTYIPAGGGWLCMAAITRRTWARTVIGPFLAGFGKVGLPCPQTVSAIRQALPR